MLEYPLDPTSLSPDLVQVIDREGVLVANKEKDLDMIRQAAMKQMQSRK